MDKGTQEKEPREALNEKKERIAVDWEKWLEMTTLILQQQRGTLEHNIQSNKESKDKVIYAELSKAAEWTLACYEHLLSLLDALDEIHNTNQKDSNRLADLRATIEELKTQVGDIAKALTLLDKKFTDYEPFLAYIKQFKDEREREDKEKEKWK